MTTNDIKFDKVPPVDDISGVLEDVFGIKLDINGGWGYDNKTALIINSLNVPLEQFYHMFASMRANVEMNLTLEEDDRFAGINVTLTEQKEFEIENKTYDVVTFKITAIKEKLYADFIQEYKDNYGKKEFDLDAHFKRRSANTIELISDFWFFNE